MSLAGGGHQAQPAGQGDAAVLFGRSSLWGEKSKGFGTDGSGEPLYMMGGGAEGGEGGGSSLSSCISIDASKFLISTRLVLPNCPCMQ